MKVKPIGARVLIQEIKPEETTRAGILLPANPKEKTQMATVLEVGEGTEEVKVTVAVGDKVIFSQYAGTIVKTNDTECRLVDMNDILAKVED